MAKTLKKVTLFDSVVAVEAGYPNRQFFPTYNGKETKHAKLCNKLESLEVGEGLTFTVPDGTAPAKASTQLRVLIARHSLRAPRGHRFRIRRFSSWEPLEEQILITVVPVGRKKKKSKSRSRVSRREIPFIEEIRTYDQILLDKIQARKSLSEYRKRMQVLAIQRKKEAVQILIDEQNMKDERKRLKREARTRERNTIKRDSQESKDRVKKARETYEEGFDLRVQEFLAKEIRLARRRGGKASTSKVAYKTMMKEKRDGKRT